MGHYSFSYTQEDHEIFDLVSALEAAEGQTFALVICYSGSLMQAALIFIP